MNILAKRKNEYKKILEKTNYEENTEYGFDEDNENILYILKIHQINIKNLF